ncbi:MAG: T9SS type A sorting domain-containing protein [Bacteroidia bacterium]
MKSPLTILFTLSVFSLLGQSGPNSPATTANNAAVGTLAWTSPANITSTNNAYASIAAMGNTNYLMGTNFGFAISSPSNIDGIVLEIEKKELNPSNVAVLNNWSNGLTKTISAGTNRYLFVVVALENGGGVVRDVTSMTYGGQAMTQMFESNSGTPGGFHDKLEFWGLNEAGIAAAVGTTIVPTYAAGVLTENVEFFTSISMQHVDQIAPLSDTRTSFNNGAVNPHQLGSAVTTLAGGIAMTGVICGNNTSPASAVNGTNTYAINSGFTEGVDIYVAHPSFSTSGISIQTATKVIAANGSEQPTFNFAGTPNRHACFGVNVQRARALDNEVRLLKSGTPIGNNLGLTATAWGTTDAYTSYGGPTNLWGTTWSVVEVNSATFGAALAAKRQNGNLEVDHFRITIYSTSTLPIELLEFTASPYGQQVKTNWVTASELNNDYFIVERSNGGDAFVPIGELDGAGNSTSLLHYEFYDPNPLSGISYYRLKQVDFNGQTSYSAVVPVYFEQQNTVSVFPNPSVDGVFTFLQSSGPAVNEVAVFSTDMRLVKKVTLNEGEQPIISIADQADGIYFLIYTGSDGKQQVSKVQKMSREY